MDCFPKYIGISWFILQSHPVVYKLVIVPDIRIERAIVAWKPRQDIHILTLDKVDDGTE